MTPSTSLSTASALIIVMVVLLVYASIGHAGQNDVPDITMSVLESEEGAELTIPEIPLPERASPVSERATKEARERGREFGQERAEQARDRDKKKPGKPEKPGKPDKPNKPDRPDGNNE